MGLLVKLDICPQRELQHILTSHRRYFLSCWLDPHGPTHCVAFSCRHYCGSCSLCILLQCWHRRVHIVIPIPHLHMSLPTLLKLWLQLDFVGVVILTLGGFVSGIYVGFYCDPALQKLYWSMVS